MTNIWILKKRLKEKGQILKRTKVSHKTISAIADSMARIKVRIKMMKEERKRRKGKK